MTEALTAVIGVVGSALTGVLGYVFRELQIRRKPFIFFRKIDEVRKGTEHVDISEHLIAALKPCFYTGQLHSTMTADDYHAVWDRADDIKRYAADTLDQLTNILSAADVATAKNAFKVFMSKGFGPKALFRLAVYGNLPLPTEGNQKQEDQAIILPVTYSKSGGTVCAMLHFEDQAYGMGKGMDDPTVRLRCEPFLNLISEFDLPKIHTAFAAVKEALESERETVLQVIAELDKIKEDIGRWAVYCTISNLGTHPFAISTNATASIKAGKMSPEPFDMYLTLEREIITLQGQQVKYHGDCDGPLSLNAGESATICWISTFNEKKLKDGGVIRELYKSNDASHIKITFGVIRNSLLGESRVSSPWWPFS